MAQGQINLVWGEEANALDQTSDATSLSSVDVRVILSTGIATRGEAVEALERIKMYILDTEHAFPLA